MARQKIMIKVDENNAIDYVEIEKFIKAKEMNFIVNIIENLGEYNHEWYYKSIWYWYRC